MASLPTGHYPLRRRSHQIRTCCTLLVTAMVALMLQVSYAEASSPLTWEPPGYPDYSGFVTLYLSAEGNELNLDDGKDYRLVAPSTPIAGHTNVRGGRNIVWIGGHTRIDWQGPGASAVSRRAITFRDNGGEVNGRTIHLEGYYADGSDLTEGIDLAVPTAVVQIQNVRIERLVTRGSNDLNGQEPYAGASHPDLLQPWGGVKELRIDGLTGRSGYQHLWMLSDPVRSSDRLIFRRVNTEGVSYVGADDGKTYVSHTGWGMSYDWTPQMFVESGTVWHKHNADGGSFKSSFASDHDTQIASDATGTYAYYLPDAVNRFNQPLFRNLDDTSFGRIYSGLPPGGDYVPKGMAGATYVSPGYGTDNAGENEGSGGGTLTFTATDDAEIRQRSADTNYGSASSLSTDRKPSIDFVMKFNVSELNGRAVKAAKLQLHSSDGSVKGGDLYSIGSAWSESTVTWNNAPVSTTSASLASLGKVVAGKSYEIDLSSLVRKEGIYAFRVQSTSRDAATYTSRETAKSPQLILTVE